MDEKRTVKAGSGFPCLDIVRRCTQEKYFIIRLKDHSVIGDMGFPDVGKIPVFLLNSRKQRYEFKLPDRVRRQVAELTDSSDKNGALQIDGQRTDNGAVCRLNLSPGNAIVFKDPLAVAEIHDSALVLHDRPSLGGCFVFLG